MIAIIDYSTGNIRSVTNALDRLGAEYMLTADHDVIRRADRVLLPGVGEAARAMAALRERGLDALIPTLTQPLLGICIGLQLLCRSSQEGDTDCMSVFDSRVELLESDTLKIPEMGWNTIEGLRSGLFDGVREGAYVYYVHSYAATLSATETIATTDYGVRYSAALARDNFYGCQFHPEKSGDVGEIILSNFLKI